MSDPSLTTQLCDFILKHEPVRTPALREAFPDCTNPASLLAGPVKSGYLVMCEIGGLGVNGRSARIAEYRLAETAKGLDYEAFKRHRMPSPSAAFEPLKIAQLNSRVSSDGALEQPLVKRSTPAKRGAPPLSPWPGKKEKAAYAEGNERYISTKPSTAESSTAHAGLELPEAPAAPSQATAGPVGRDHNKAQPAPVAIQPIFAIDSTGCLVIDDGGFQIELNPVTALALADFTARVRPAIEAALARTHTTGASA